MELIPHRPRVLLFIDKWHWAFHTIANAVIHHLSDSFTFTLVARDDLPVIDESAFDIIHIFYEYETYHRQFLQGHAKIVRSVYSHYWEEWGLSAPEFYKKYLDDAHAIAVPSQKLFALLKNLPPTVALTPEGVDIDLFHHRRERTGPLVVGWAGDPSREIKRLPMLKAACEGHFPLRIADGSLTPAQMVDFYNEIDVIACSSIAEGCPRPILEGMACGCFPVTFDVGIASEVIDHEKNGIIVQEQSAEGLRRAFSQCTDRLADIRSGAAERAHEIATSRTWKHALPALGDLYRSLL